MASEYKPNLGVFTLTGNTTLNPDAYAGKTIVLSAAAGLTVTLPAATGSGARYELVIGTSATSNQYRVDVTGSAFFVGVAHVLASATTAFAANGSTHNRINMTPTTTGGLIGGRLVIEDTAANRWAVTAVLSGSGTGATPFAAV